MGFFRKYILSFYYGAILFPFIKFFWPTINVMNTMTSLEYIKNKKASFIRFGDGELSLMRGKAGPAFQKGSASLQEKLLAVFSHRDEKLLICLPQSLMIERGQERYAFFWRAYMAANFSFLKKILNPDYRYGDALLSRPFLGAKDKSACPMVFNAIKALWDEEDILIIEGVKTKFGAGNDLLANAKSIRRILAPCTNAFEKHDELLKVAQSFPKNTLVILALGPAAKPLALALFERGFRVFDLGHLDIEYEWFLRGAKTRIAIPNKYVNETRERFVATEEADDLEYRRQIYTVVE